MRIASRAFVIVLSALVLAGNLSAQEADDKEKQIQVPFELQDFWLKDAGVSVRAWGTLLGEVPPMGGAWNPFGVSCARLMLGDTTHGLPEWKFVFDEALPLWGNYLDVIKDGRILPSVSRKEVSELKGSDWGMYCALNQAIDRSHTSTLDQFKKSAAAFDYVGYPQLAKTPADFRGKVITVKGRIKRIFKDPAPRHTRTDIQYVYTTHIQTPFKGEPPYAVVFTELPQGLAFNEKLDVHVTFHGYFLALVSFPGDVKKGERDVTAPYLVGKTLERSSAPPPAEEEGSYSYQLIVGAVGIIVAILALTVMLNFWFRRGDQRIESQLAQVRDKHHPFSLEEEEELPPMAPPIAEPVKPAETPPSN
jgi:hypothetical protein